jgi:dienelactone hydrolase
LHWRNSLITELALSAGSVEWSAARLKSTEEADLTVRSEAVAYEADGISMIGEFFCDASSDEERAGVLVFPEGFGLGDHAKQKARKLAELGYAALACDLHGKGSLVGNIDEVMARIGPLLADPLRIRARASEAMKALLGQPNVDGSRLAAIGFCFGGTMALELARSGAPIKAAVGFHSGLGTVRPGDAKNISGKVLALIGADDPSIDANQRAAFETEMREGQVDWRMYLYGGVVHSFTNPEADALNQPAFARYDAGADERSWQEMLRLFEETLT